MGTFMEVTLFVMGVFQVLSSGVEFLCRTIPAGLPCLFQGSSHCLGRIMRRQGWGLTPFSLNLCMSADDILQ